MRKKKKGKIIYAKFHVYFFFPILFKYLVIKGLSSINYLIYLFGHVPRQSDPEHQYVE